MPSTPQPIFDGHHDALTRKDADRLVEGRDGGHLDLPRAAAGGLVASMWAIFCEGPGVTIDFEPREGGGYDIPLDPEVAHDVASAEAIAAAGRLLALERGGHLRVARTVADLDAAADGGLPAAVMHLEGAECIDPGLEALDAWPLRQGAAPQTVHDGADVLLVDVVPTVRNARRHG